MRMFTRSAIAVFPHWRLLRPRARGQVRRWPGQPVSDQRRKPRSRGRAAPCSSEERGGWERLGSWNSLDAATRDRKTCEQDGVAAHPSPASFSTRTKTWGNGSESTNRTMIENVSASRGVLEKAARLLGSPLSRTKTRTEERSREVRKVSGDGGVDEERRVGKQFAFCCESDALERRHAGLGGEFGACR